MTQGLWPMDRVDPCVGTNLIGYIEGYMYDRPIERVISQQQRRQRPYIEAKAYSEALERREWAEEFGEVWEDRPGSGLYYHHQWDWRPKDSQDAPPGFHDLAYFQQYVQGLDPEVYNHYALLYGWKPWLVAPKQLAEGRRRGRYREARQVAVDGRKVLVHEQSPFAQAPQRRPVAPPEPATVRTPRPARMGTIDLDALIAKALHGRTE
jgi:hypothetical protein